MKLAKSLFAVAAAAFAVAGQAAVLTEGFDNLSTSGWILSNSSTPVGADWFQGNDGVFASQAGAADAYAAASFLSTPAVNGAIDNWLISPVLALGGSTTLTFYTRTETTGFGDHLDVLFSSGAGTASAGFTTLASIGPTVYPTDWTEFTIVLPTAVTGRVAFRYSVADASNANYIGVDTVSVTAAVPEPSTYALMALGLAGVAVVARRKPARDRA